MRCNIKVLRESPTNQIDFTSVVVRYENEYVFRSTQWDVEIITASKI